jgi:hypothetical protein
MTPRTLRIAVTIENALKSATRPSGGGMGHWYGLVQAETPGADYGEVLTALKHLWRSGIIVLTKTMDPTTHWNTLATRAWITGSSLSIPTSTLDCDLPGSRFLAVPNFSISRTKRGSLT